MHFFIQLVAGFVLALVSVVSAAEVPARLEVGDTLEWAADRDNDFPTFEQLQGNEAELQWQEAQGGAVGLGFRSAPHWFRFELEPMPGDARKRYLQIPEALLNRIDVFVVRDGEVVHQQSMGQDFPFDQRPVAHRSFVMPVELSGERPSRFYVRIQANSSLQFEPIFWDPQAFSESTRLESIASGLFYGFMLMMLVYNLFTYFVVRDRSYLYYIFVVAVFMLFMGSLHGDAYQFLWPGQVWWNETSVTFAVAALSVVTFIFTISFLELRQNWPRAYYVLSAMLVFAFVLVGLSFVLDYNLTIRINSMTGLIVMPTVMFVGIVMWSRGHHHARYFVMAWLAWMLGISILALSKFGVLPYNAVTANGAQLGVVLKAVLLSFGLGDRINQERAGRLRAQEELIAAKESVNQELEARVKARTSELETALQKLETVNQFLEEVSNTDQLTGLANRHCFVRRYHEEYKRAHRHQYPISIILMDIDHFKWFNDTYGHIAGDECLKAVSQALSRQVTRAGDVLARYGGEEFIVLLNGTALEGACTLAERLRDEVAQLTLHFDGATVPVTVSLGVADQIPQSLNHSEQLIQNADDALYAAKEHGRNRVCRYPDDVASGT